jgi:hypothetical protein
MRGLSAFLQSWVVERAYGSGLKNRRMSKDDEEE